MVAENSAKTRRFIVTKFDDETIEPDEDVRWACLRVFRMPVCRPKWLDLTPVSSRILPFQLRKLSLKPKTPIQIGWEETLVPSSRPLLLHLTRDMFARANYGVTPGSRVLSVPQLAVHQKVMNTRK